jgi:hypothetical protein
VTVVTDRFVSLARASAKAAGYPDLPLLVLPHPFETLPVERLRALADETVDACVALACASPARGHD